MLITCDQCESEFDQNHETLVNQGTYDEQSLCPCCASQEDTIKKCTKCKEWVSLENLNKAGLCVFCE
jgi:hypothetical protein